MAITDIFGGGSQGSEMEKMCGDFQLTRTQRFYGFGICFVTGVVLSVLGSFLFWTGNVTLFAVLYTLGNVLALIGTGFLIGFVSQFKKMFDESRWIASCVYLGALILTLVVAFTVSGALGSILVLICVIIQYFALFWYSISYIPFARDLVKNCLGGLFGR